MSGALADITVLDLSRILAGPYATMVLGDLGARVIKVEQPGSGDDTRRWGPPFTANGESAYFLCANRNKESITVDLKTPAGREIIYDLARRADVAVENFRRGGADALSIGYSTLSAINPRLVYCAITGYGQSGPASHLAGYDAVIQAQGGIMSITGPEGPDGLPTKVGVAIVDISAGLHAAIAVLAALHERQTSGRGQFIDIALYDAQLSWLANVAAAYLLTGDEPQRYGNAHATIVPYQTFPTADGWIMLAVGNDRQFEALCRVLGRPEWALDPRFATNPERVRWRAELVPLLETVLRDEATTAWQERLEREGVPCGAVRSIPEALLDPQARARGMVQTIEHPVTGSIDLLGPVPKMGRTTAAIAKPPPLLGEHTDQILGVDLGYSVERLRWLHEIKAV